MRWYTLRLYRSPWGHARGWCWQVESGDRGWSGNAFTRRGARRAGRRAGRRRVGRRAVPLVVGLAHERLELRPSAVPA